MNKTTMVIISLVFLLMMGLFMAMSIDIGDESECHNGEVLKSINGLWTCDNSTSIGVSPFIDFNKRIENNSVYITYLT